MTRLLVSVRNREEAQIALAAGVDLIDVKEPNLGSLGAASATLGAQIVALVAGRTPVSAALGELLEFDGAGGWDEAGVDYAKFGLAGCADFSDWPLRWRTAWQTLRPTCGRIAVAYADWQAARAPHPQQVLEQASTAGCAGLLIDTFDKAAGSLFAQLSTEALQRLIEQARQAGLLLVLAGGLQGDDFRRACALQPDYVAVRGAVCQGGRSNSIDPQLVAELVDHAHHGGPRVNRGKLASAG